MWPRDQQRAAQALDRYLQGDRVTAIAADLHISPSTVRRWINDQLSQIAQEENTARVEQLQAAIETQRATAREAWAAYHREQARLESLTPENALHRPYIHAHTYLRLALIAQREVARLQGLYTRTDPPTDAISITIQERPAGPENHPPFQTPPAETPPPPAALSHKPRKSRKSRKSRTKTRHQSIRRVSAAPRTLPCEGRVARRAG